MTVAPDELPPTLGDPQAASSSATANRGADRSTLRVPCVRGARAPRISDGGHPVLAPRPFPVLGCGGVERVADDQAGLRRLDRSEEHTSELQSPCNLVCR